MRIMYKNDNKQVGRIREKVGKEAQPVLYVRRVKTEVP